MRATARLKHRPLRRRRTIGVATTVLATVASVVLAGPRAAVADDGGVSDQPILGIFEVQSLNGVNNNPTHPDWGRAGSNYLRVAPARYADGRSTPVAGPNSRFISNRVFNDISQNVFSENRMSQWGWTWGQFIDHTIGLAASGGPTANIGFNPADPLESFTNTLGSIPFARTAAAPNTGVTNPRQQINTVSSYIDASAVYGDTDARLDWLREGSVDGDPDNNGARLLMPNNYLPRRDARGNPVAAPAMDVDGRLAATPTHAFVAGDTRANENLALTATQTLFAREHNRIVSLLPSFLSEEDKFQLARVVVAAEQQYITYNEFLPAMGVQLPTYTGYDPNVNQTLTNEFATVAYRAHSQVHGEFETETNASRYTPQVLAALRAQGVEVEVDGAEAHLVTPLNVAFFNPDLLPQIQLGPVLEGLGKESQYRNDEMIDNQLRSVLFQVPVPGNPGCLDGPTLPQCFKGVLDLGAVDIERSRDHGMPSYNQLRAAYGLPPKTSFAAITGEASESFPSDPLLTPGNEINDPNSLDNVKLFDINGKPVAPGSPEADTDVTRVVRRTPLAARLKAIYGSVDKVDAFVGMMSEPHVPGTEMGQLQRAVWTKQFQALRDGNRFFYLNDPLLPFIQQTTGIDYRRNLAQVIASNTDIPLSDLSANVFRVDPQASAATTAATLAPPTSVAASDLTRKRLPSRSDPAGATALGLPALGGHTVRAGRRTRRRCRP